MKRKSVAVTGIALLLGSAVFTLGSTSQAGTSTSTKCGVERWKVKTLQDRPKLHAVKPATVAQLISVMKPVPLPGSGSNGLPFSIGTAWAATVCI